jgi:tRNA(adenine34) deaminase
MRENKSEKDNAYFMRQALVQAEEALARNEFPVGCVIVHKNRIVATGARAGSTGPSPNEVDHAEMVALRQLSDYQEPYAPGDLRCFCTMEPCLMCFGAILLNGIYEIVYAYEDVMGGGTSCPTSALTPLYSAPDIKIVAHVERQASLALFQAYFNNPDNHYWQGSLLAEYTLAQKALGHV